MTKYSLSDIKKKIDELALKINAPTRLLPSYGQQDFGKWCYIDVDRKGYMFYISVEDRGKEYEQKTSEIDDLLYWIFDNVTFSMACDYELKNRIEDKDNRRMIFDKQETLLGELNEAWRETKRNTHQHILKSYPFDDLAGLRATFCGQLRKQGYSETEIKKMAYEKYPYPASLGDSRNLWVQ